ncbi:DMT family transporter [Subtercola endophyticus]|uniref:DMT family transporter n=1 Tax=Subtercola endophyticus TaxID=2895559 RepID=UPI001E4F2E56|nr:DMT family transporter [Subtercola endophyticus]UFS58618.1 DMT family transporter [Subtercola endophyticus]
MTRAPLAGLLWVVVGSACIAGYPLLFYASLTFGSIATCTVVSLGSAPVFAALVERTLDGKRLSLPWLAGTIVAIIGVALLAFGSSRSAEAPATNLPVAIALATAAGLAYTFQAYSSRRLMALGASPTAAMGALFGGGSIILVPLMFALGAPLVMSWNAFAVGLYFALLPVCAAYILYAKGLRLVPASLATTFSLSDPAVAAILAVLVLGERITAAGWIGIAVVAGGILLASLRTTAAGVRPRPARVASADTAR